MDSSILSLVIPAYNEAENLPRFIPGLLEFAAVRDWQVIIVNDGSTDGTREALAAFAESPLLTIVHHKLNRGYGAALKTGLAQVQTPYAVTLDADGQHCMEDIEILLKTMLERDADLVIGSRDPNGCTSWYREMGKSLIRLVTKMLLPLHIRDLNSGFKLYRTELVQAYMHAVPDGMSFSDIITLVFISEGRLVCETPVQARPRLRGKSTISTKTAIETVFEILNIVVFFNPMKIFLPVALFFLLFGVIWGTPIILQGRGVSVGSMLLIMIGIILMFLSLVAEQLSHLRKDLIHLRLENNSKNLK